jgi:NADPH:quinone reductase-like Zn-dependent oxidoreductase
LTDIPNPVINDNEVLVQIHATAINLLDKLIGNGEFKIFLPYKEPFTNGHDMAGVVIKVGPKVTKFKVGDEVYSRPRDHKIGTFAELISVNENDLSLKPKNISMEEASSIPLV